MVSGIKVTAVNSLSHFTTVKEKIGKRPRPISHFLFSVSQIGNRKTTVFLFPIPVLQIANRKMTHFLFSLFDGQIGNCKTIGKRPLSSVASPASGHVGTCPPGV